ncbi:MAG: FeoB-associated Cys-rich membrane protein [Tannerellaceae bacterium]|jgi:hypothetical protein|nr:FeoB-associated Cys-rich membrane protein [Tannerellaceae bacterium]
MTYNVQLILVAVIGILTVACTGYRVYRLILNIRRGGDSCAGCRNCALKKRKNKRKDCPKVK